MTQAFARAAGSSLAACAVVAAAAAALLWMGLALAGGAALAAPPAPPVLSAPTAAPTGAADAPLAQLTAEVSLEVTPDELVVSLQAQHAGKDLAAVNQQAAAAAEQLQQLLRRHPDLVVRSQRMTTGMDYDQGKPQGWRVRNSLTLTTTRADAFDRFWRAGGSPLELLSMGYQPSEALKTRTRQQLIAMAGVAFRDKSLELAKSLGYRGFEIRDVTLQEPFSDGPVPMLSTLSARSTVAAAPVVQEGQARLSLKLAGRIALLKN